MSINAIVAVGNKAAEKHISAIANINVLTSVRTREAVLDAAINFNPHVIVLAKGLPGKVDLQDLIIRIRKTTPDIKIVFLYGNMDNEFKYFANVLVENEVYNFIVGDIDPLDLATCILETRTADDVKEYVLADTDTEFEANRKLMLRQNKETPPEIVVQEKTVIRTLKNFIQIAVIGNTPHIGASTAAQAVAATLSQKGYKVALIEHNTHFYQSIYKDVSGRFSYFEMLDEQLPGRHKDGYFSYENIDVYSTEITMSGNARKLAGVKGKGYDYVVLDCGVFGEKDCDLGEYYKSDLRLLVVGVKPHENNLAELFAITPKDVIHSIRLLVYSCTAKQFAAFEKAVKNPVFNIGYMPNPYEPTAAIEDSIRDFLKDQTIIEKKRGFKLWQKQK